jgi:hypothetical protein
MIVLYIVLVRFERSRFHDEHKIVYTIDSISGLQITIFVYLST